MNIAVTSLDSWVRATVNSVGIRVYCARYVLPVVFGTAAV